MKKFTTLVCALLTALAATASYPTSGSLSKNVSWTLADSVLTLTGTGKTPGYNTTSIGSLPWQNEDMAAAVRKIVVEEGITELGAYIFGARAHSRNARDLHRHGYYNTQGATTTPLFCNIRTVELPSSLRKIGAHAFVRMPLTHVRLPEQLEEIGAGAFSNSNLVMVIVPPTVRRLGPEAFGNCQNLRAIDFGGCPLKLSNGLLFGAESLRMVLHTSNIVSIEPSTFNATPFNEYSEQAMLDMLHSDGLPYFLKTFVVAREAFSGSEEEYARMQNRAADQFYEREAANATSLFDLDRLTLLPYNAETGTLTIETVNHGLLLLVLSPDEAADLCTRWKGIRRTARPVYRPANGAVELQSVNFSLGDKTVTAALLR